VTASLPGLASVFVATKVNYGAILPMLIVFGAAALGVLVEAFVPRSYRYAGQVGVALVGLLAALGAVVLGRDHQGITLAGAVVIDGPALFLQGTILAMAILSVFAMAERFDSVGADAFTAQGASTPGSAQESAAVRAGATTTEVFPLTMFAVGGMLLFPAAGDLLTMFVALEVLSLPLYILSGLARRRRLLSQEASMKYFLLGAFSSAFFLFGSALLYGYSGSMDLSVIAKAIGTQSGMDGLLIPGVVLVLVGLLFKIGAVPFHSWTPDVYQGAPTPVTGFMAACTKVAAFGAILRFIYVGVADSRWDWAPGLWAVAILTMVVGAVLSVTQTDIKRLLAYSSIAHAGFVMVGLLAFDRVGISAVMFYVVAYGFATIAAFALVSLVREGGSEATHLSQWAGLGKNHPVIAGLFAFLLLAFAGIPLTSGFTAKFAVFAAAIGHGATMLAVVGVLCSAIAAFVYVRVIVLMYFSEPSTNTVRAVAPSMVTTLAVSLGVLVTLVLGVLPSPLLDLAARSALFLR
jgi:NADH-quinone oxidoreductase subunit N